jgi:hypothetical protein
MATFDRAQCQDSFESQLSLLRPHLTRKLLEAGSLSAWHAHGAKGEDPVKAAKSHSASMDAAAPAAPKRR